MREFSRFDIELMNFFQLVQESTYPKVIDGSILEAYSAALGEVALKHELDTYPDATIELFILGGGPTCMKQWKWSYDTGKIGASIPVTIGYLERMRKSGTQNNQELIEMIQNAYSFDSGWAKIEPPSLI
jgi:hypothetical protein